MTNPLTPVPASASTSRLSPLVLVLGASALLWGLLFTVLPPSQQSFPLNDDWAFARGAFQFALQVKRDGFGQCAGSPPVLGHIVDGR